MITATIDKSVLLSNIEVQRNSEFEHQRKEKELNETVWSLFVATEALRDILVDGGRRTWGELSPKQVTALWIGAASSIGAVGLGLDWGMKWLLLPLAAAVFRAPSDHRAVVFALCFAAILLGLELFILKGTQIDGAPAPSPQRPALSRRRRRWLFHRACASRLAADGNIAVADKEPAIPNVFSTLHSPTLSWASVPLLPGTLGMLSGGGFRNRSEVTLVAQDGTEHATPALDASTAALKFKMPDVPGPHLCAPLCISHSVNPAAFHPPPPALHFVRVSSAPSLQAPMTLESMAARRYRSMCPICARPQVEQS